jgi:predicted esterase
MKLISLRLLLLLFSTLPLLVRANDFQKQAVKLTEIVSGEYVLIIDGYDWGPGVNKVVLDMEKAVSEVNASEFSVVVERSAEGVEINDKEAKGDRKVVYAYVSDEKGNSSKEGEHVTLVLFVSPNDALTSPIKYIVQNGRGSNKWIDYKLTVTHEKSNSVWNTEADRVVPPLQGFDLTGTFTQNDITLTYGSFSPKNTEGKSPLLIWLHGGGEGGTDPSIALIANKAWNYASEDIQSIFAGAYVLAPQTPTFWMQSDTGDYTRGDKNDTYNEVLMGLIKKYVADNPNIDSNRIYVGSCSNGGYMSLKLILEHPDYFTAAYISALAYHNEHISDEQVEKIKNIPIWFVHSKDDPVTIPKETVVPLYKRLIDSGADKVHLSFYEHVVDLTGFYGGEDYHFNGHWSWIYSHVNHADFDFDGSPVLLNGNKVTVMEWLAAQSK